MGQGNIESQLPMLMFLLLWKFTFYAQHKKQPLKVEKLKLKLKPEIKGAGLTWCEGIF